MEEIASALAISKSTVKRELLPTRARGVRANGRSRAQCFGSRTNLDIGPPRSQQDGEFM